MSKSVPQYCRTLHLIGIWCPWIYSASDNFCQCSVWFYASRFPSRHVGAICTANIFAIIAYHQHNHHLIDAGKTKELVWDSAGADPPHWHQWTSRKWTMRKGTHKYLSIHLNNKLDWGHNNNTLYRKGQSSPFAYVKLTTTEKVRAIQFFLETCKLEADRYGFF